MDGALRVGTLAPSSLVARPLGSFRMVCCASPDYTARYGVPSQPDDLAQHWAVHYGTDSGQRKSAWQWQDGEVVRSVDMRGQVTVDNAETHLAMPVHWVYPHRHQLTPRLQVFSRWLAQLLAPYLQSGDAIGSGAALAAH